jgi:dihydroflavonol-4-reductase
MKILVTGAGGFIGKHLVPRLLAEGHEVHTFTRSTLSPLISWASEVQHVCGDVCNPEDLNRVMPGIDVVYHLAGLISYRSSALARQRAINIEGTRNVMQYALQNAIKRVVHTSSIAGMGIPEPDTIGDETISYNLTGRGLTYCDTKHEAEEVVQQYYRSGLGVVIIDPGIILGEGDSHPHHHTIFQAISRGWLIGCPAGGVMFSDIKDVVEAHINAMTLGTPGDRYVIGNANLSYFETAQLFSRVFNSTPPKIILPGWLVNGGALASETTAHILCTEPVLTRQMAWLSQQKIFFSWVKAERELRYTPMPFESTVRRVAPHYLKSK